MEAKRGHGENTPVCDWWKRPRGRVDVNAQGRRVTSVSLVYLSFLSDVPSTRLSHVCVRNLVKHLQTSSFLCFIGTPCSTMVKLAKVRAEFVISGVLLFLRSFVYAVCARGLFAPSCCESAK